MCDALLSEIINLNNSVSFRYNKGSFYLAYKHSEHLIISDVPNSFISRG